MRDHILAMDDKLCTETFLVNLITYAPSREDDLVTMQKFLDGPEEDCQKLDLPEQFTIEVIYPFYLVKAITRNINKQQLM